MIQPMDSEAIEQKSWHSRAYPSRQTRNQVITRILDKKQGNRSGHDWWLLGEYQVINGLLDKDETQIISGEESLIEGASLDKPNPACLVDLGWLLYKRGSVVQARRYFLDATKVDPYYRDAWAFLGITEIATNNRDRAINAFQKAVSLFGENPNESDVNTLKKLKASPKIPTELQQQLIISKFSLAEIINFDHYDQVKALRLMIDEALEMELPTDEVKELLDHLCTIEYSGLSSHQETIDVCKNAIEYLDTTHTPHLLMGLAYKKLGKKFLSLEAYKRCLEKNPHCELAITNLAEILMENSRPREAYNYIISFINSGTKADSGNIFNNLGNAIAELGMPVLDELTYREKALRINPKNPKFILNYVLTLIVNGDLIKAKGLLFQHKKKITNSLGEDSTFIHDKLIEVMTKVVDPFELFLFYRDISEVLGVRDASAFLVKAWEKREQFNEDDIRGKDQSASYLYPDFLNDLGIFFGNAQLHKYSLKCWQELQSFPGHENASWNIPVSLDSMGLHKEALEALKHASGDCTRKNTITANLLKGGDSPKALDFYLKALEEDDPFLMPIKNGFALAKQLNRRDLYTYFLIALSKISDSAEKTILYSEIKMQQGFFTESCSLLESILVQNGAFLDVKQLQNDFNNSSSDLTLLGERVDLEIYKQLAYLYILTGKYQQHLSLADEVSRWDIDLDGDWRIIESIALSMQGRTQEAIDVVSGMSSQPPPILAKAFALFRSDDLDGAIASLSDLDQFGDEIDGFNFPLCLPSSFRPSLESLHCLSDDNVEKALHLANFAIGLDPSSIWITDIYTNILEESCGLALSTDYLLGLHQNAPGNTKLLRKLIMSLAYDSRIEDCRCLLYRLQNEYGKTYIQECDDLWRMIDILTLKSPENRSPTKLPEWACLLDDQARRHLQEISELQNPGVDSITYSVLISRFSEYLLKQYFFLPLASLVEPGECIPWERAKNSSDYLLDRTQTEPSLGDVIALIKQMAYSGNRANPYIRMLRQAASHLSIDSDLLFSYDFVGSLCHLRNYRNCIMHADAPLVEDFKRVQLFVFAGHNLGRGQFISCLNGSG